MTWRQENYASGGEIRAMGECCAHGGRSWNGCYGKLYKSRPPDAIPVACSKDFGAEIREWADFALSRSGQATRRDTGMPRPVMMLMTLQATLASVFCVGRVRAWRPRPITFLYRNIATSAKERFP